MTDNICPALYDAVYVALPVEHALDGEFQETVCISGRYCESGDISIAYEPRRPAGASYHRGVCLPITSNYNLVPRPVALLIDEQHVQLMERRETYEDLLLRYQF